MEEILDAYDVLIFSDTEGFVMRARGPAHPMLKGIDLASALPILGYKIVKPRKGCPVLAAWQPDGHPAVAVGRFGKGRVLAYTSDPAPRWGCNFVYWEQYNRFWPNAMRWLTRG